MTEGRLEEIQHEEFTILLHMIEEWLTELVVTKSNPLIRKRIDQFSDELIDCKSDFEDPGNISHILPEHQEKFGAIAERYFAELVIPLLEVSESETPSESEDEATESFS